jgi:hypothetical protein
VRRGYFYCSVPGADPITGPNALSTSDLTGLSAGGGLQWSCYEVPIGTVSKWATRVVSWMERLGFYLWE